MPVLGNKRDQNTRLRGSHGCVICSDVSYCGVVHLDAESAASFASASAFGFQVNLMVEGSTMVASESHAGFCWCAACRKKVAHKAVNYTE